MNLGTCCNCETNQDVIFIVDLNYKAPIPGTGWGCLVCNLPPDGAVAVLCVNCRNDLAERKSDEINNVCVGFPGNNKRIPYLDFIKTAEVFIHNRMKHAANRSPIIQN